MGRCLSMDIKCYLAMTASELFSSAQFPDYAAYMACHFSGSNPGLSNLPTFLPPGSMMILDDLIPPQDHDPELIVHQLKTLVERLSVSCFLLDFQRAGIEENRSIVKFLVQALPCPVGVSSIYAEDLTCPVFLPPVPLHTPLKEHLHNWAAREVWLEIAAETAQIKITDSESTYYPDCDGDVPQPSFEDHVLCCHYHINVQKDHARFTLRRDKEDLRQLLRQAQELNVNCVIGPYQQLYPFP